jgi:hypothetical protein
MTQPAKKSKSLFNSFTRIHRLATLGGISIAAWFSSQFLQNQISIPEAAQSKVPSMMSESSESMMMRSIPEQSGNIQDTLPLSSPDPQIGILLSVVAVLSVIVSGLIIELIIKQKLNNTKHN